MLEVILYFTIIEEIYMITLYSTGCPKCKILEQKLSLKNIEYNIVDDVNIMLSKGFTSAPMLEIDGIAFDFPDANKWVNSQESR